MKHKAAFQLERHGSRVVYRLTWNEVRRILGRDHANTAADDAKLARALRAAGARPLAKSYCKEDGWHAYAPKGVTMPALAKRRNPATAKRLANGYAAQILRREQTDRSYLCEIELSRVESDGSLIFRRNYQLAVDKYPGAAGTRTFLTVEKNGQTWIDQDITNQSGRDEAKKALQSHDLGLPRGALELMLGPIYREIFAKASEAKKARPKAQKRAKPSR